MLALVEAPTVVMVIELGAAILINPSPTINDDVYPDTIVPLNTCIV